MSAAPKKGLKKGLGRGFESLIPTDLIDDSFNPMAAQEQKVSKEQVLPIAKIIANPEQPRRTFDETALAELSASIKEHGVLQPILVTPHGNGYQIVAGERRYRASKLAGLTEVPVVIRTLSDQHQLEVSLIENIQRRDLNAVETAVGYAKLRDQFNLTGEQIAGRVNKSTSAVTNTMRLLKLPKEVLERVAAGELTEGQARPLIGQDEALLLELVPKIISEGWSARKIEHYISTVKVRQSGADTGVRQPILSDWTAAFAGQLKERLKAQVNVTLNAKGAGKIVIGFKTPEELERIQKLLGE